MDLIASLKDERWKIYEEEMPSGCGLLLQSLRAALQRIEDLEQQANQTRFNENIRWATGLCSAHQIPKPGCRICDERILLRERIEEIETREAALRERVAQLEEDSHQQMRKIAKERYSLREQEAECNRLLHGEHNGVLKLQAENATLTEQLHKCQNECERLRGRMRHSLTWLGQQAGCERKLAEMPFAVRDPAVRATFVEAHNAVLGIFEGRYDLQTVPASTEGESE